MTRSSLLRTSQHLLCLVLIALVSTACAQQPGKFDSDGKTVPFQLRFTPEGKPVVLSPEGKPLEEVRIQFPIKTNEVVQVYNFNAFHAVGSSYIIFCYGPGYCVCIDLPNPNGTKGNACATLH